MVVLPVTLTTESLCLSPWDTGFWGHGAMYYLFHSRQSEILAGRIIHRGLSCNHKLAPTSPESHLRCPNAPQRPKQNTPYAFPPFRLQPAPILQTPAQICIHPQGLSSQADLPSSALSHRDRPVPPYASWAPQFWWCRSIKPSALLHCPWCLSRALNSVSRTQTCSVALSSAPCASTGSTLHSTEALGSYLPLGAV